MHLTLFSRRISMADRTFLARQLATMLGSGLAIDRAVAVLANETKNPLIQAILKQIETDLEAGLAFSTAIAKHPRVFNRVFVNVVIAGEAVGKVAEVLQDMANRLEKQQEFVGKIKGALYYPIFVMITILVVGAILMIRVVPQVKSVFDEAQAALPFTTQLLVTISTWLASEWWLALILFLLGLFALRMFFGSEKGHLFVDFLALRFPTGIARDFYMARFTQTLSLLIQSGTPIIEALSITAEVVGNRFYTVAIEIAKEEVSRGIPLSVPIAKSPIFPLIVPQMILVGEETGRLDQVLESLAKYFEQETDLKLKSLASLFEPVMIIIVGIAVGFIVFAIFVPLYQIARFG
ncbi:type II secretion system F family protein [Candidatus Berkelbacteria bacterium]|nr:type II secretion system F family protein [Candidatus Berkelbacteria bacterium]